MISQQKMRQKFENPKTHSKKHEVCNGPSGSQQTANKDKQTWFKGTKRTRARRQHDEPETERFWVQSLLDLKLFNILGILN